MVQIYWEILTGKKNISATRISRIPRPLIIRTGGRDATINREHGYSRLIAEGKIRDSINQFHKSNNFNESIEKTHEVQINTERERLTPRRVRVDAVVELKELLGWTVKRAFSATKWLLHGRRSNHLRRRVLVVSGPYHYSPLLISPCFCPFYSSVFLFKAVGGFFLLI